MKKRISPLTRRVLLALLACVTMSGSLELFAQDAPDLADLDLEDLMKIKVASVFGASKFLQKVTEAPASISIVTGSEIRAYGYRTIGDVLRQVGGFSVNYDRNYTYVGVRGFQRPGDYNSRILLLVDGHRMNDSIYDMAFVGTEFPVDLEMIERMEVIRGPSSSIYGTNAFLAVVNIVMKTEITGLRGFSDVGTLGTRRAGMTFGKTLNNGLTVQLSGSAYRSNGQRRLYFQEFDSPATNNGIAENLDTDTTERFLASASLKGFTFQSVYGSREKKVPTAAYATVFNDPHFKTKDVRGFADLRYDRSLGKGVYLTSRVYYDAYNYDGAYPEESIEPSYGSRIYYDFAYGKWWGTEVGIEKRLFQKNRLTAGGEYRDNYSAKQGAFYLSPRETVFENVHASQVAAAYVDDEFSINKALILNMGVRHDRYDGFGGTTNPRFGLIYSPFDKTAVKILWGTAFRAPNAYEMFYYNTTVADALKPETIDTREVVFEKYISDRYRFSANVHKNRIRSLIAVNVDADGVWTYVNKGAADTKGFGFEFESRRPSGVGMRAVYAFQQAQDGATRGQLTHSARHLANANMLIPVIPRKILAGLDVFYVGPTKTLTGAVTDGFVVPNLTFSSPILPKKVDFSASIYNLFNTRYGYPGNEEHIQNVINQDGRTFRVQIGYTWSRE